MIVLLIAMTAILFFSFRAHEEEVRANVLESRLDAYMRNEVRITDDLIKTQQELRKVRKQLEKLTVSGDR